MRGTKRLLTVLSSAVCVSVVCVSAQVLAPQEILDPKIRELQQKYFPELKLIAQAALLHNYPYHFYFSRRLDLAEKEEPGSDQRAIQIDQYKDKVVLKITGNYFAAYSTDLMTPEERARQTYQDVMLPLLQAAAPNLVNAQEIQAFAFEISHHVRKKILGVTSEGFENVVLVLPKASAEKLAQATSAAAQQAALAEGEVYLNAKTISLWPRADLAAAPAKATEPAPSAVLSSGLKGLAPSPGPSKAPAATAAERTSAIPPAPPSSASRPAPPNAAPQTRETSPEALNKIQSLYQARLDRMVQELNAQAHFVRYAPPVFIPFHKGVYLQVSITTDLQETARGSQYQLAALAFDQHIAHLIRPTLSYFRDDGGDFDGVDFSTSVRLTDKAAEGGSLAVEFVLPIAMLHAYEEFDCTGQQLIDSGFVLINGERVSLNLQNAEAGVGIR